MSSSTKESYTAYHTIDSLRTTAQAHKKYHLYLPKWLGVAEKDIAIISQEAPANKLKVLSSKVSRSFVKPSGSSRKVLASLSPEDALNKIISQLLELTQDKIGSCLKNTESLFEGLVGATTADEIDAAHCDVYQSIENARDALKHFEAGDWAWTVEEDIDVILQGLKYDKAKKHEARMRLEAARTSVRAMKWGISWLGLIHRHTWIMDDISLARLIRVTTLDRDDNRVERLLSTEIYNGLMTSE